MLKQMPLSAAKKRKEVRMVKIPTSGNSLNLQGKDNHFEIQKARVFQSFYTVPKTMKECDKEVGVMRESICWFCRDFRKANTLYVVGKRLCSVTRHRANVYSTNEKYKPASTQLPLFTTP
jgi:hypothetical protein